MESVKSPDTDKILAGMQNLGVGEGDDIIRKPRTNFSSNVLRRAVPVLNVKDKIGSISINNLGVLSAMRIGPTGGSSYDIGGQKKVYTLTYLPKVQSLDSGMISSELKRSKKDQAKNIQRNESIQIGQRNEAPKRGLDGIEEGKAGDEDVEEESFKSDDMKSEEDKSDGSSDDDDDDDDDSSIDMDGDENEEKLYEMI